MLQLPFSVTIFVQNLKRWAIIEGFVLLGKKIKLLWQKCFAFGQIFIVVNGQIFKN